MGAFDWVRAAILAGFAVSVAVWDVRRRRVPNGLSVAGLVVGLGLSAAGGWTALAGSLAGSAAFGGPLLLAWLVGLVGAGDAKAAFAFGALLGMPAALGGLLWGAAAGAVLAVAMSGALLVGSARAARAVRTVRMVPPDGGFGFTGSLALVAAHPAWQVGIPYAAALAAGSLWAFALVDLRL